MDDVLLNKSAVIERCIQRIEEEYYKDINSFVTDYTRQDAAILNIQRACEASIDMGQYFIRRDKLGVPQSSRDVFVLLAKAGKINNHIAESMKRMVGFRNIAVHDYQTLQLTITIDIVEHHLGDIKQFATELLAQG